MTKHLTYRTGTMDDLDALQVLRLEAYGAFQSVLTPDNWEIFYGNLQNKQKLLELLNISTCFVCLDNQHIVGAAYVIPSGNPTDLFQADWSYIRMVGVHPKYQGQGIARQLTQLCINFAKQNNESTIALHTSEFMDAARHLYENLGFRVLKEIPPLFGKTYWIYTLDL